MKKQKQILKLFESDIFDWVQMYTVNFLKKICIYILGNFTDFMNFNNKMMI